MWVFGYTDEDDPSTIKMRGTDEGDLDAMDESEEVAQSYRFVSCTYDSLSKSELIECIKRDGWWFVDGECTDKEED